MKRPLNQVKRDFLLKLRVKQVLCHFFLMQEGGMPFSQQVM